MKKIKLVVTLINISSDVKLVLGVTDVARLNLTLTVGAGHEGVYLRERELTIVCVFFVFQVAVKGIGGISDKSSEWSKLELNKLSGSFIVRNLDSFVCL